MRLDEYIREKYDVSRSKAQKLNKDNLILVNGKVENNSYLVKEDDEVVLLENKEYFPSHFKKQDIKLDIIYEDEYLLVVNKPSNMVVHPGAGNFEDTLLNALLYHYDFDNTNYRAGIVHRLDKDTSGLIIVAKDDKTLEKLSQLFKERKVKKEYLALVDGVILNQSGEINLPIGRDKNNRKKMAVTRDGKKALSKFEVLKRYKNNTLILCNIVSGRTHQIRVHMAYIKHPVTNDSLYGKEIKGDNFSQYLHAYKIEFIHPITNKLMKFEAELPDEFKEKLESLE